MKTIMIFNIICFAWMGTCFYLDWEPWTQVAILAPNMLGWTLLTLITG